MVHFCCHSLTIELSLAQFLTNREVPCTNVTCDRQNTACKGCRGKDVTSQNYVINVHVQVHDQSRYEQQGGLAAFSNFRSFHFTKQLMDVAAFRSINVSDLSYASSSLRKACNLIPEYINENGG